MAIYLVKHPDPTFTGFRAGLDFSNGIASTNSQTDAQIAARAVKGTILELGLEKPKEPESKKRGRPRKEWIKNES